MVLGGKN